MPFSEEQAAGKTLYCRICGEGSCRRQWARDRMIGKLRVVACARHSDIEFGDEIRKAMLKQGKTLSDSKGKN